jgi:hypothetical protein
MSIPNQSKILVINQGGKHRYPILQHIREKVDFVVCITLNKNNWA